MKSRVNKRITLLLTGAACVLFCTQTASADIVTFWKTDTCPNFGGAKVAIASEVGVMEAPADFAFTGVGGAFCVLDSTPRVSTPAISKGQAIDNARIKVDGGDQGGVVFETWRCVICQYKDKINIPTISLLGTVILMAGLLTAAAYRIGKNQKREAAA